MKSRFAPALAGILAAAVALATGELVAGLLRTPSPVVAVGDRVIQAVPEPVERFAIATFGTNDKLALVVGILVLSALFGALLGLLSVRRPLVGVAGLALFGVLGMLAALGDARTSVLGAVLPSLAAALAGSAALLFLLRRGRTAEPAGAAPAVDRRAFLRAGVTLGAVAVAAAAGGRWLQAQATATAARAGIVLPGARRPLDPLPAEADLGIDGLAPFTTPNEEFYRIDTALQVPQVDVASWRLKVTGMVDRPLELTFDDLLARDLVEADVTLACVSNDVGGGLVGNARWLGVRLDELLTAARVRQGATQVVGRAVDGFTVGFPTEVALDGRDALVAVGMNGEPLPIEHGFPARLVVPGLYGYVSATKWLAEIELTTLDGFDAYWVPRGWSKQAPVKTQSRIDVPAASATVRPGRTAVAGVAWAQHRGIDRVEVQVDDGPWSEARLSAEVGVDCWRQWVLEWDASPGDHTLRVRATDRDGDTQTEDTAPPAPDGATGWHTIGVRVAGG
jgi:DMSO/TMAO reductase YedYZ molybdopterin-dependent catalytic subunit